MDEKKSTSTNQGASRVELRRNLTLMQEKFVAEYTDPTSRGFGNATRAAEAAGYRGSPGSNQLSVQGHHNLRNPRIKKSVSELLDAAGASPELATQRLAEGMNASMVRVFLTRDNKVKYSRPLPSFAERRAAAVAVLRLHGLSNPLQKNSEVPEFAAAPEVYLELSGDSFWARCSPQDRMAMREAVSQLQALLNMAMVDPTLPGRYPGKSMHEVLWAELRKCIKTSKLRTVDSAEEASAEPEAKNNNDD